MSVLVQRPHQVPGVISLPRQHFKHIPSSHPSTPRSRPQPAQQQSAPTVATLSPKAGRRNREPRQPANNQTNPSTPPSAPNTRSNKRRAAHDKTPNNIQQLSDSNSSATVLASQSSVSSSGSPTPASTATNLQPTSPPRKSQSPRSTPNTPTPANAIPVPNHRRRAKSPRSSEPASEPVPMMGTTWQQAELLKSSSKPANRSGALPPLEVPATAFAFQPTKSAPSTPARLPTYNAYPGLAHSDSMPDVPRRSHNRAPSMPLDALFVPSTPPNKGHARNASVSASLPAPSSMPAQPNTYPRRQRTPMMFTGPKFAAASFQLAPDEIMLPKPKFGGLFAGLALSSGSSASESDSSEESEVIDLGDF